jgi:hypothetical protein
MWAVLLMGSNSVIPWTMPKIIMFHQPMLTNPKPALDGTGAANPKESIMRILRR